MASAIDTATAIIRDPALPRLLKQIAILRDLEVAEQGPTPPGTPPGGIQDTGLGLHRVVRALDAYLWFRRNRWIAAVVAGGLILIPGVVGFALGKASSRCKQPKAIGSPGVHCVRRHALTHACLQWSDGYRSKGLRGVKKSKSKKSKKRKR